jgi:hypothetical protein
MRRVSIRPRLDHSLGYGIKVEVQRPRLRGRAILVVWAAFLRRFAAEVREFTQYRSAEAHGHPKSGRPGNSVGLALAVGMLRLRRIVFQTILLRSA